MFVIERARTVNSKFRLISVALFCSLLIGCSNTQLKKESQLLQQYDWTLLKFSSSADVIATIAPGDAELLSQSENALATWGQNEKGSLLWFNAVAFDEEKLTATRKYCFLTNEKAKQFLIIAKPRFIFYGRAVIASDILDEPYPNQNAKRIAIFKNFMTSFNDDMIQLTSDSHTLQSAVLMVKQSLTTVLRQKLDLSPALAARFEDEDGLGFLHPTLGKAVIRISIENGIADINIEIGKAPPETSDETEAEDTDQT